MEVRLLVRALPAPAIQTTSPVHQCHSTLLGVLSHSHIEWPLAPDQSPVDTANIKGSGII